MKPSARVFYLDDEEVVRKWRALSEDYGKNPNEMLGIFLRDLLAFIEGKRSLQKIRHGLGWEDTIKHLTKEQLAEYIRNL
jgi:hypothetical protein